MQRSGVPRGSGLRCEPAVELGRAESGSSTQTHGELWAPIQGTLFPSPESRIALREPVQ